MPKAVVERQQVKVERKSVKSSQIQVKAVVWDLRLYQNQLSQSCTPPTPQLIPSIEGAEGLGGQPNTTPASSATPRGQIRNCKRKTNSPSRPRSPLTTTHYHPHIHKNGEADSESQCARRQHLTRVCSPGPFLSALGLQRQRAHGVVKPITSPKWESTTANNSTQLLVTLKVRHIQKRSNQRLKRIFFL